MINKYWTERGLAKLGKVIQAGREARGLTLRQAAAVITATTGFKISYRTINRIEKNEGTPEFNTLAAIAASDIVRGLDIYDFVDIASEDLLKNIKMNTLIHLIKINLLKMTADDLVIKSGINYQDLLIILAGNQTDDMEQDLWFLSSVLLNPETGRRFGTAESLAKFCHKEIPTHEGQENQEYLNLIFPYLN